MENSGQGEVAPKLWSSVLTDIHFWVPVTVLIGGLILLSAIR